MGKYDKDIDAAISSYTCPYCRKMAKSSSGRTLHIKVCKAIDECIEAAKTFKTRMKVRYQLKDRTVYYIRDGLVLLDNGDVAPATGLRKKKPTVAGPAVSIPTPKSAKEWVKFYIKRYEKLTPEDARSRVLTLYRATGYAKYRHWTEEDVKEALDKGKVKKTAKKKT